MKKTNDDLSDAYVVWYYKREKRRTLTRMAIFAALALFIAAHGVLHLINHSNRIVFSMPEAFCIYSGSGNEYDLQEIMVESGKRTYHINADGKCFSSPGSYVYVTGKYWWYPFKPTVRVDGEDVKVKTSATGYGGRNYHFYIRDVVPEQKYRVYVRCGEKNDYMSVVFHEQ